MASSNTPQSIGDIPFPLGGGSGVGGTQGCYGRPTQGLHLRRPTSRGHHGLASRCGLCKLGLVISGHTHLELGEDVTGRNRPPAVLLTFIPRKWGACLFQRKTAVT